MKTTIKQIFESDNWVITRISQGLRKNVRIDAKTRFFKPGEKNSFSEWCSERYADSLSREKYGKKTRELNAFQY